MGGKAIKQIYLIKKEFNKPVKSITYMEYVFSDYSESRRKALKVVRKINLKKSIEMFSPGKGLMNEIKEITSDFWTDGDITISIEVFPLKELVNNKKKIYANKFKKEAEHKHKDIIDSKYVGEVILMNMK